MELLYFTDISQVQYVLDKEPQLLETMRPVTGDIVVASELESLDIPFIDEWDFLEPIDIERNFEIANNLGTKWWDENIASTEYEGFALTECAEQDLVWPFEACLNARVVYEKIFRKYQVDHITGYFLPPIGVVRTGPTPTHRAIRSLTQAVLFWVADKYKIQYKYRESGYSLSAGNLTKNNFSFNKFIASTSEKTKEPAQKIALVVHEFMPASEHSAVKEAFKKLDDWKTISIGISDFKSAVLGNEKVCDVKKRLQFSWETFIKATANDQVLYPEIFANPHLNFQFKRIWDEMETAVEYGNVFSTFLDTLKPSVILFGFEAFTIERVFVRLAQKKNIPTIGLVHGGLGHRFGYRGSVGDADSVLVWNKIDIANLKIYGVNESRLHKIGCIRYELKFEKYIQKSLDTRNRFRNKSKQQIGIPADNSVVLILTATINSGFAAPVANPRKHREAFDELTTLITSRKDLTFIIKAHPSYDYYEIYRRMLALNLPNLLFLEKATLDEALEASDVCLMINYFTTAALEAMLHHLPVIYLNNAVYPLPDWEATVPDFIINRINSVAELENKIDQLITNTDLKEHTFAESDKIIRQILDISNTSANDRLLEFIKNIDFGSQTNGDLQKNVIAICIKQSSNSIKKEDVDNFLNKIALQHSIENILYAFSFIAGSNNMGISSVNKMFGVLQNHFGKENLPAWQESRRNLLLSYISGHNNNSSIGDRNSAMRLIGLVLLHPKIFIFAPIPFRNKIIKYLINTMIGSSRIVAAIINWTLNLYKKLFN